LVSIVVQFPAAENLLICDRIGRQSQAQEAEAFTKRSKWAMGKRKGLQKSKKSDRNSSQSRRGALFLLPPIISHSSCPKFWPGSQIHLPFSAWQNQHHRAKERTLWSDVCLQSSAWPPPNRLAQKENAAMLQNRDVRSDPGQNLAAVAGVYLVQNGNEGRSPRRAGNCKWNFTAVKDWKKAMVFLVATF